MCPPCLIRSLPNEPFRRSPGSNAGLGPALLVAAGVLIAGAVSADSNPIPVGDAFAINTTTTGTHYPVDVAMAPDGSFMVVWEYQTAPFEKRDIRGRRFDSNGSPLAAELQINAYTTEEQRFPKVAAQSDGSFVVVWSGWGPTGSGYETWVRRYDSNGATAGDDLQINTITTQRASRPRLAVDDRDRVLVAWSRSIPAPAAPTTSDVDARLFEPDLEPIVERFQINSYTTNSQYDIELAANSEGSFLVTWQSWRQDGDENGIFGRLLDSAANPTGSDFQINQQTEHSQIRPAVASFGDGSFLVSWAHDPPLGVEIEGVPGRRVDATGTPVGDEFAIDGLNLPATRVPALARDRDHSIQAVYALSQVLARRTGSDGVALNDDQQLTDGSPVRYVPAVASDGKGRSIVVWTEVDFSIPDDKLDVFGQLLVLDSDDDGLFDHADNCPDAANADQADADGDQEGDACDLCFGNNASGDGDGDQLCADLDCNDDDPLLGLFDGCGICGGDDSTCGVFGDDFETGDTDSWTSMTP